MSIRDELARLAQNAYYAPGGDDRNPTPQFIEIADAILAAGWSKQAPCVMTHTPPFDFAECETHDETFPLGETCRFHERDMVEVLFEAADEQRMRAVRAEMDLDRADHTINRVRAIADEWSALPCVCGYQIPNGNDDSSQCLACASDDLRAALDGDQ